MKLCRAILTFGAWALLSTSQTMADEGAVKATFGLGFTNGGDTLATATLVSSSGSTNESVKAGGQIHFFGGAIIPSGPNIDTLVTLGYFEDSITATDGDVSFKRITIDAIPFFKDGPHRFGAGITYHSSPKYSESGAAGSDSAEFDNALGFVLDYGYYWSPRGRVDLRYVSIDYELTSFNGAPSNGTFDGNHIGLYGSFVF